MKKQFFLLFVMLGIFAAGCGSASFNTLQPPGNVAKQKTQTGIALQVYPFSSEALPDSVLERTTPVFVHIQNGSKQIVRIEPIAFTLLIPGRGVIRPMFSPPFESSPAPLPEPPQITPLPTQQAQPSQAAPDSQTQAPAPQPPTNVESPPAQPQAPAVTPKPTLQEGTLLPIEMTSWAHSSESLTDLLIPIRYSHGGGGHHSSGFHGGGFHGGGTYLSRGAPAFHGGGSVRVAPPYHSGFGGSVRVAPPYHSGFGGHYYHPAPVYRPYGRPYYRGGYWGGYYRRWPYYGYGLGFYPGPYVGFGIYAPEFYGYGWPYNDYVVYGDEIVLDESEPAEEIMEHRSLPALNLAAGKGASGFIYFPRLHLRPGTQATLIWQAQDENGKPLEQISVPVVIEDADEE